jgi:hypothetical protein
LGKQCLSLAKALINNYPVKDKAMYPHTEIPQSLRALIDASQVLQKESSPIVQTPMGPRPTVAASVNQGLNQLAQSSFDQQPTVHQAAQQAGIGGGVIANQIAQQQAQQAQQPAPPEQQGIATIPVNMQFAEGGIIGFAGEDGSVVPQPQQTQQPLQMPTAQGVFGQVEKLIPDRLSGENGIAAQYKDIAARKEKAIGEMPDLNAAHIEAIQRASAEREAIRQRRAENDNYDRFMAMLSDVYHPGAGVSQRVEKGINDRDEINAHAKLLEEEAIFKAMEAQQAAKLGKFDREKGLLAEIEGLHGARDKILEQLYGPSAQMAGTTYHAALQAQTARETERGRAADRALVREQRGDEKLAARLAQNIANAERIAANIAKEYQKDSRIKNYEQFASFSDPTKIPKGMKEAYDAAIAERDEVIKNRTANINHEIKRLQSQVYGGDIPEETQAPAVPARPPVYAVNPKTNERIMSTDGGKTWQPAR